MPPAEEEGSNDTEREGEPIDSEKQPQPACTRLLWFQPETVPQHFAAILYGQRRSGKTTWLKWFLWTQQHNYDRVVCFSSTNFKGDFQEFMNHKLCFNSYDASALQTILNVQADTPKEKRENILLILDDVLDSEQLFRKRGKNPLVTAYTMGRHYSVSVIMCTQYAKCIPTSWRRNVDFAVIFYTFSADMAEVYYREYGAMLSRSQFMTILEQCTNDHRALVVRPCTKSRNIQCFYQLTQAPETTPKFFIGKPANEEMKKEDALERF